MAYAPNYTPRWKVKYRSFGRDHTQMLRLPIGSTGPTTDQRTNWTNAMAAIQVFLPRDFAVLDSLFAPEGVSFFVPTNAPNTPANQTTLGYDTTVAGYLKEFAGEMQLGFRGGDGTGTNISVFGFNVQFLAEDEQVVYRAPVSGIASLNSYRTFMNGIGLVSASGSAAVAANNVTVQYNSYWESR